MKMKDGKIVIEDFSVQGVLCFILMFHSFFTGPIFQAQKDVLIRICKIDSLEINN